MALADLRHLLGADEHVFDLCGLVGAAHPAFDAQVGVAGGAGAGQGGGQITGGEADPQVMRIERGDKKLADTALAHGATGTGLMENHSTWAEKSRGIYCVVSVAMAR